MGEKTFNLTWNNHLANLSGLFEGLYKSGSLTDTTLACQGGMLRAHRLVLAACSPYFERVFKEHYGEQPILILKGVPIEEMECLLDFMYRGSINVAEEHLPSLIKTATDLEIRGLSGDYGNESSNVYSRIEARGQPGQVETRLHQMEYKKAHAIPFLTKPGGRNSITGEIKMEEIEVEDDPMIMEGHEDSFEEPLSSARDQIRHIPPPMFKHQARFEGQKRNSINRAIKDNGNANKRQLEMDESSDNGSPSECIKSELVFNSNQDPTVPAIQINEDSMDQGRSNMHSPLQINVDIVRKRDVKPEPEVNKSPTDTGNASKDRKVASKSKAQYKPFPCDLCTLAFTRASHLARHRRVHTGERPFACSLCPRMFSRQDKLKQHLDSHLQWPKRKGLSLGGSQQQQQQHQQQQVQTPSALIGKGKRGRPRKVSVEQNALEEIFKFGEFSSMLNKSSYASCKNGRRNEDDAELRNEGVEDLRAVKRDSQGYQVEDGANVD